jgi:hypothetical protein
MKLDKNVFVALAAIAWSDGDVSEKEAEALLRAARAWSLDDGELEEIERCTRERVPIDSISNLELGRQERLLVYALGAWLTKVDGVVVPNEGAVLDRLGVALGMTEDEREIAQSDGMLVAAFMGEATRRDVIGIAREIEARATEGFEQTMKVKVPRPE